MVCVVAPTSSCPDMVFTPDEHKTTVLADTILADSVSAVKIVRSDENTHSERFQVWKNVNDVGQGDPEREELCCFLRAGPADNHGWANACG